MAAVGEESTELVLWGGLLSGSGPLSVRMRRAIAEAGLTVADRQIDPPLGAARLAMTLV